MTQLSRSEQLAYDFLKRNGVSDPTYEEIEAVLDVWCRSKARRDAPVAQRRSLMGRMVDVVDGEYRGRQAYVLDDSKENPCVHVHLFGSGERATVYRDHVRMRDARQLQSHQPQVSVVDGIVIEARDAKVGL